MRKVLVGLTLLAVGAVCLPAHAIPTEPVAVYKFSGSWVVRSGETGPVLDFTGLLARSLPGEPIRATVNAFGTFVSPGGGAIPTEPIRFARGGATVSWSDGTFSALNYTNLIVGRHVVWIGTIPFGRWAGGRFSGAGTTSIPTDPVRPASGTYSGSFEFYPPNRI